MSWVTCFNFWGVAYDLDLSILKLDWLLKINHLFGWFKKNVHDDGGGNNHFYEIENIYVLICQFCYLLASLTLWREMNADKKHFKSSSSNTIFCFDFDQLFQVKTYFVNLNFANLVLPCYNVTF